MSIYHHSAKNVASIILALFCSIILFSCTKNLVTEIRLNETSLEMTVGDSFQLSASVFPSDAESTEVVWSSSNNAVVSVDDKGTLSAISAGSATIIVSSVDGGADAACFVTVFKNTTPSYIYESKCIPLHSFKIYNDELSISYQMTIAKQINPDAMISDESVLEHQDSINFENVIMVDIPDENYIGIYIPIDFKINGSSSSYQKYLSYEPNHSHYMYDKQSYEERKKLYKSIDISSVIDGFSKAYLYNAWCSCVRGNEDYCSGCIGFHDKTNTDSYAINDFSVPGFNDGKPYPGPNVAFDKKNLNILKLKSSVPPAFEYIYCVAHDRFSGRVFYGKDGNIYKTVISESTIDRIKDFNLSSRVPLISPNRWLYNLFPDNQFIYPTVQLYKNEELIHEAVLIGYTEFFYLDEISNKIQTDISFQSITLQDEKEIHFLYEYFIDEKHFRFEIGDYASGEHVESSYEIVIDRDFKEGAKETVSSE